MFEAQQHQPSPARAASASWLLGGTAPEEVGPLLDTIPTPAQAEHPATEALGSAMTHSLGWRKLDGAPCYNSILLENGMDGDFTGVLAERRLTRPFSEWPTIRS